MSETNKTRPSERDEDIAGDPAAEPAADPAAEGVTPVDAGITEEGGAPDLAAAGPDAAIEPEAEEVPPSDAADARAADPAAVDPTSDDPAPGPGNVIEPDAAPEAPLGADPVIDPVPEGELDPRDAEIAALVEERDQLKDRLMRALAEAENIRRRADRDRKDAEAYGGTKLARDLLSVHDNLERALANADDTLREEHASFVEGVDLTLRELINAFAKHKIEKIVPEKGEKFDPNLHQAMFEAPVPGAEPGTVIEVMTVGFTISGRLLRAAMVGVARAPE